MDINSIYYFFGVGKENQKKTNIFHIKQHVEKKNHTKFTSMITYPVHGGPSLESEHFTLPLRS